MAIYMKFDGIDGESKDKDHDKWSDVLSFSKGIHKAGAGATGQSRRRGIATLEDIQVTKEVDKSSPKLSEAVLGGKVFPKVEIHNTTTYGEGAHVTFYKIELKDVMVSSQSFSASGGGNAVPVESFSLNYSEIKETYIEYDSKGSKKGNVEYSWKVEEGTK